MALANAAEIMAAYDAVLSNELNWFLLHYPSITADELALFAFGSNGLEELKTKIDPSDIEQVLVGFVRVDDVAIPGAEEAEEELVKYVLISYVPRGVLGVRRARAKVHSRRLGMIFKKHDAVLTVEDVSQLTNTAIAHILAEPDPSLLTFSGPTGTGPSSPPFSTPYTQTTGRSDLYNASPVGSPAAYQQQHPHHQSLTATDMGRSFSQPVPPVHNDSQQMNNPRVSSTGLPSLKPIRRSFSETQAPLSSPPGGPGLHKTGSSMFSQFFARKKRSGSGAAALGRGAGGDFDESQESEDSMPPPTPPKDKGVYAQPVGMHASEGKRGKRGKRNKPAYGHGGGGVTETSEFMYDTPSPQQTHEPVSLTPALSPISESSFRHIHSVSEFAVISHEEVNGRGSGDIVVIRPEGFDKPLPLAGQERVEVGINTLRKGKWAGPQGLSAIRDPSERAWLRMEMQRQKVEEEQAIIRAEEERQERFKRKKEESQRREEEEAERRRAEIQAEAMRVAAERRRRKEEERLEEERKAREREERKKSERAKRLEEHQRLEEWRREQQIVAEEAARREEEAKRREEEERKAKILKAENEMKQKARGEGMTGYVTIQTDDSVVWRRRYYKFSPNTFYFYRNAKVGDAQDLTQAADRLDVRSAVKALKEPKDGYEDLEAIPFSFVVEFHDRGPWSMYADSEEEKFKLLGLLKYAAGLPV